MNLNKIIMSYTSIGTYKGQGFSVYGKEKLNANDFFLKKSLDERNFAMDEDGYYICYFKVRNCIRYQSENRFGSPKECRYDLGLVGSECIDYSKTLAEAKQKIEILRKVENHTYCGFGVVELKDNVAKEVVPNEYVNITGCNIQAKINELAKLAI